jgi:hypothetical protein
MAHTALKTLLATAVLTLMSAPTANAAATTDTILQDKVPVTITAYLACTGEMVEVSGNLHRLIRRTVNGNRVSYKEHFQPMGLAGYGTVSGDTYHATGVTQATHTFSLTGAQQSFTSINRFHFVGTAGAASFYVKETYHYTFNANGELTSLVENYDVTCE